MVSLSAMGQAMRQQGFTTNRYGETIDAGVSSITNVGSFATKTNGFTVNSSGNVTLQDMLAKGNIGTIGTFAAVGQSSLAGVTYTGFGSIWNTITASSAATNFFVNFATNRYRITVANTNINLTFSNIIAGATTELRLDNTTGTVSGVLKLPAGVRTNGNVLLTITNGIAKRFLFDSIDGTSTNIDVTDAGFYRP